MLRKEIDWQCDMERLLIHRYSKFLKALETLRRSDRRGLRSAKRAEALIKELASGDLSSLSGVEKRTKHGERRINNCIKYDLGGGYRLVTIKYKGYLIVTFLGSHDHCDRWIENNRRFETDIQTECTEAGSFFEISESLGVQNFDEDPCGEEDYDDILMEKIDEEILKSIFRGLYRD
jgi:hypothetical protein